ncbi:hypothetical protein FB451DRAFT_414891 [Mycena latifolia]|nr:hypothetical protein FB451DRAFT_414891 [Mycena latifolia]
MVDPAPVRKTPAQLQNVPMNVSDPFSLALKREALEKGGMTTGLKIWLNPKMVDVKKMAAGRRWGYISVYDRKIAEFAARKARVDLLLKQRAATSTTPHTILQLLRHRDRRQAEAKGQVLGRGVVSQADRENVEEQRLRAERVKHLLSLRGAPTRRA